MDIASIKPGIKTVVILTPNGDKTGLEIDIVSTEDERVKTVTDKLYNIINKKRGRGGWLTPQERDEWNVRILVAATVGWRWGEGAEWNKAKPKFDVKNTTEVYAQAQWIARQIDEALGGTEGFFPA